MEKPFGGKIKNWEIHQLSNGLTVFTGIVAEDAIRFKKDDKMRSSPIEKIEKKDSVQIVETMNTIYHLIGKSDPTLIPEPLKGDSVLTITFF